MSFLSGGGEVGALMRAHDWSRSPLGHPDQWPAPLRSVVGLLLPSKFPMFVAWGPELGFLYNDAYAEILGAKHPASLGARFYDIWSEIWADISPLIDAAMAGEASYRDNLPLVMNRHGFDELTWFTFSYSPVRDERGAVAGMFCAVAETTPQVLAQRRQSFRLALEERLRDLSDPAKVMIAAAETAGRELGVARVGYGELDAAEEYITVERVWTDGSVPPIVGQRRISDFGRTAIEHFKSGRAIAVDDVLADERTRHPAAMFTAIGVRSLLVAPLIKTGRVTSVLFFHHPAPRHWSEEDALLATEVADRTWAAVERARAETERRWSEQQLRELNETLERRVAEALAERKLLADIVEGTDLFVQVADVNYRWLAINKAAATEFARIFGVRRPDAGDNMLELLADRPDYQQAVRAVWSRALAGEDFVEIGTFGDASNDPRDYEMQFRTLRNERDEIIGAYQFVQDVTERLREQSRLKDAEAALMHAQKMEAVGRLTGGIAHDFNNLLGAIVGSFELIRRKPDDLERVERLSESGLQVAERGAKLTGQLLAFSRSQRIELKPVDLTETVGGMRELLGRALGPMIRLNFELGERGHPVLSDPTQLELAVLNLAINARDAMPHGGDLTIRTRVRQIAGDAELAAGEYVEIAVIDSGTGMPQEIVAKAFDPFFTTKPVGEGTGLGLSQVYGIARQAGGTARIDSEPGRGTSVTVLLPGTTRRLPPREDGRKSRADATAARPATILVVDDDDDMRRIIASSLRVLGYEVRDVKEGSAGLRVIKESPPDLMVVDFAMPGMTGADVAKAARKMRPELPIVFASGYTDTAAIEGVGGRPPPILRKPFRMDELQTVLAAMLASPPGHKSSRHG